MIFVSNINNPHTPESFLREDWEALVAYAGDHVIGPPQATSTYTTQQLADMGMVGVYREE